MTQAAPRDSDSVHLGALGSQCLGITRYSDARLVWETLVPAETLQDAFLRWLMWREVLLSRGRAVISVLGRNGGFSPPSEGV